MSDKWGRKQAEAINALYNSNVNEIQGWFN